MPKQREGGKIFIRNKRSTLVPIEYYGNLNQNV
jgi:hypothetical protein